MKNNSFTVKYNQWLEKSDWFTWTIDLTRIEPDLATIFFLGEKSCRG